MLLKLLRCSCTIVVITWALHLHLVVGITFFVDGADIHVEVFNQTVFLYTKFPNKTVYRDEYVTLELQRVFEAGPNLDPPNELRMTVPGTDFKLADYASGSSFEIINTGGWQRNASVSRFAFPNGGSLELYLSILDSNGTLSYPAVNETVSLSKGSFKLEVLVKDWPFKNSCKFFNCCLSKGCFPILKNPTGQCNLTGSGEIFYANHAFVLGLQIQFFTFVDLLERPVPFFGVASIDVSRITLLGKRMRATLNILRWGIRDGFQRFRVGSTDNLNGTRSDAVLELVKNLIALTPDQLRQVVVIGFPVFGIMPCFESEYFWDPDLSAVFTGESSGPVAASLSPQESLSSPSSATVIVATVFVVVIIVVGVGVLCGVPSVRRRIFPYRRFKNTATAVSDNSPITQTHKRTSSIIVDV